MSLIINFPSTQPSIGGFQALGIQTLKDLFDNLGARGCSWLAEAQRLKRPHKPIIFAGSLLDWPGSPNHPSTSATHAMHLCVYIYICLNLGVIVRSVYSMKM